MGGWVGVCVCVFVCVCEVCEWLGVCARACVNVCTDVCPGNRYGLHTGPKHIQEQSCAVDSPCGVLVQQHCCQDPQCPA